VESGGTKRPSKVGPNRNRQSRRGTDLKMVKAAGKVESTLRGGILNRGARKGEHKGLPSCLSMTKGAVDNRQQGKGTPWDDRGENSEKKGGNPKKVNQPDWSRTPTKMPTALEACEKRKKKINQLGRTKMKREYWGRGRPVRKHKTERKPE